VRSLRLSADAGHDRQRRKTKADGNLPEGTLEFKDLSAAVDAILKETTP
jgi:hypothetical protein